MKYKLSQLFEKPISGEWGSELEEGKSGAKVIRTTNFTDIGILNLNDVVERDIDIEKYEKKILKVGDIIIEKSGGSPTKPVGRVVIFEENTDEIYFCNNFTSILRPKNVINPKYSLYMLKDLYNKKKVLKYQNKTTGIINLKLNDYLSNTEINLPSVEDQIKIVKVLDKAQELIDKRKEQIEALDELVKSKFIDMFGDLEKNVNNFEKAKMKDICSKITDGTHKTPNYLNKGIKFISAKDIKSGKLDLTNTKYISLKEYEEIQKRCQLEFGDILLSKSGSIGTPIVLDVDEPLGIFESLAVLKIKRNIVNNIYVCEFLKSYSAQRRILFGTKGISIKHLHLNVLKELEILIPPIQIQNEFAEFVNKVDKLKIKMGNSLKELEDNFNSLMQRAFKGELFN